MGSPKEYRISVKELERQNRILQGGLTVGIKLNIRSKNSRD
jgi:hypothetical protein